MDKTGKFYSYQEADSILNPFKKYFDFVYPPDTTSKFALANYFSSSKPSDVYINSNGIGVIIIKPKTLF